MKLLSRLRPAETLLILESSKADLKQLMKVTFMDLLLKQALETKEVTQSYQRGSRYRERTLRYVIRGKNFNNYKPAPYEQIYLDAFVKSPDLKAIFTQLIKVAYRSIDTEKAYRKTILRTHPLPESFHTSLMRRLVNSFSLSEEGEQLQSTIRQELQEADQKMNKLLEHSPKEALQLLTEIGGNLFLLKNVNFALLCNIDRSILSAMQADQSTSIDAYGWWDLSDSWSRSPFDSWDSTFDSFDSGYDAAGCSSHSSGCSSCSGCSGCSGCGGCN